MPSSPSRPNPRYSWKDTTAWLRRMPTHWRLLLASQALFLTFAVHWRYKLVQRHNERIRRHVPKHADNRNGPSA